MPYMWAEIAAERRGSVSMRCLTTGLEVNYPCSPVCPLFGDCTAAFNAQQKARVKTNADRIRAMSDEELAHLLTTGHGNFDCSVCKIGDQRKCDMECGERCLAWLQQPAEEGDHEV